MRKFLFSMVSLGLLATVGFLLGQDESEVELNTDEIVWMSFEEAVKANENNPKMIFIDFYTDWCRWCKVMDNETFSDPDIIKYMNSNFYAVKFDAEQKETINFQGHDYKFLQAGRRGIHELAFAILDKQPSYPSFAILNKDFNKVGILKGFMPANKFEAQLNRLLKEAS